MTLYSSECTEAPPHFSTSDKILHTPGDSLFLRRLIAVTTSSTMILNREGGAGSNGRWGAGVLPAPQEQWVRCQPGRQLQHETSGKCCTQVPSALLNGVSMSVKCS